MLKLSGKIYPIQPIDEPSGSLVLRISSDPALAAGQRQKAAFLVRDAAAPPGCAAYLVGEGADHLLPAGGVGKSIAVRMTSDFGYLEDGDVIRLNPSDTRIRALYRRNSTHNSFLVTERCDNYCLMCSQPPRDVDDDWIIQEILETLPLIHPDTKEIGFTGGEPTLLGDRLIDVLKACKEYLPKTAIHVLSNGRHFVDPVFAQKWAGLEHPDLMVGIPIYSDLSHVHDYVVQADGAYDETLRGILNLKRLSQKVEIRVVLHQATTSGLPRLAAFLARNLLFVDHVALMGLEMMGFTRANLDQLWIDPVDYQAELYEAVCILADAGMRVSIYNHQLCLLDRRLWPYAVKSISDWKNEYFPECDGCGAREQCGGFFASAKFKRSENIRAIT